MQPVHVFFFRGLSTYGHDNARWSVFDFGPVFKHFARALSERGIQFHPVIGMGAGTLVEVATKAKSFIEQHPAWQDPTIPVHFLGHSAGGLAARMTMHMLARPEKILSCLTIASPHAGSTLAQICIDMPTNYRGSNLFLRGFGYDIASKRHFFHELTRGNVELVVPKAGLVPAREASIVCSSPRSEWCRPLRMFHMVKAFNDFNIPSDGVVERDTQEYGDVIAELKLDHFRQVGLFGETHRFEQMCDLTANFFKSEQARS